MSCLFISIGKLLNLSNSRGDICNYMESHLKQKLDSTTIEDWIMYTALVENKINPSVTTYIEQEKKAWGVRKNDSLFAV